jgi:sugar lactone lactonase YvrE
MQAKYIALFFVFLSCNFQKEDKVYASPKGYDLTAAQRYRVRQSMQEISGIVLAPDEHHILAINDEEGKIYAIDLGLDKPYPSSKFDKNGDYEELATTGTDWFVLKSNGHLYHISGMFTDSVDADRYKLPLSGKREFESLYFDPRNNSLVTICKNCPEDKKSGFTTAYRFPLNTMQYDTVPAYRINIADIARLTGTVVGQFKPSGAAIHPIEKRLYIISAVNRMLVITDLDGKVQEAYNLRRRRFGQPEGISFAANGDMYISNEAADESQANILKFKYH